MSDEAAAPEPVTGPQTYQRAGFNITSVGSGRSAEQLGEDFDARVEARAKAEQPPEDDPPREEQVSDAAAKLGKKGGEAAAKAREKAAKEKPAEDESEEEPEEKVAKAEGAGEEPEEDEGEKAKKKVSKEIEDAPPHKKKQLASERVAEVTRESAALKRELATLKREIETLKAPRPAEKPTPAPVKAQYEGREDEYIAAQVEHRVQQALAQRERKQEMTQAQLRRQSFIEERRDHFLRTFEAHSAKDPQVREKIAEDIGQVLPSYALEPNETPGPENFISTEIMMSDDPIRLLLYLSEHPEQYRDLAAKTSPREITREIARIEDRLAAPAGTPAKPSVSKAPPPVRPVTGAPHTAEQGWRPGMSLDEYARVWRGQNTRQ